MKNGRKTIAIWLAACLMAFSVIPPATAGNEITLDQFVLSQEYIVKGDPLAISGTVHGLSEIRIWLFGPQCAEVTVLPVLANGSFSYSLSAEEIREMESGDYYVVLQSSGEKNIYDITLDEPTGEVIDGSKPYSDPDRVLFTLDQVKDMQEAAPDALVRAIKETAGDDGDTPCIRSR